ncbi:hypothetical protein D1Z90_19615 [Motilimonas pumila]|uniref:Exonuclease VII large subunit C-terminal domain-containing protein n=1 Tax=Motilimonas pumila TaxID=2303987 RepID=A0A418Y9M5_9GAMM|nr:hypothetical protein D1Z90_19615 [Motilimonas pumila]
MVLNDLIAVFEKGSLFSQQRPVIAPSNAAGLHDFKTKADLLQKYNLCHFDYFYALFQGERRVDTITAAFSDLVHNETNYDCVCIIRGGGDAASLSELAEWKIALMVCRCPYPVFSGIGHENDEILIDEYTCRAFPTPSMVVSYIYDTISSNAKSARSSFDYISKTIRMLIDSHYKECEAYNTTVLTRMWMITKSWRIEIERLESKVFNTSCQDLSNFRLLVANNFNHMMRLASSEIDTQRSNSSANYECIKMSAYKVTHLAKLDIVKAKVDIDKQSYACIDRAKKEAVARFNIIQVSSAKVISEWRSSLIQAWLGLSSQARYQLGMAKQRLNQENNNLISNTENSIFSSKMEVDAHWFNAKKTADNVIGRARDKVVMEYKIIDAYDPQRILERGYSIVYMSCGKVMKNSGNIPNGEKIKVRMKDGFFKATIN